MLNPNPTSDVSQIQFNCDETVTGPLTLRIISYTGQIVGTFDFPDIEGLSNFNLNLSSLSAGIYLAKVIAAKYSAEESFVVTK
ncbi:MAG: T9SS type A sorting domain-containing protein [Chitinophagales bacterium]